MTTPQPKPPISEEEMKKRIEQAKKYNIKAYVVPSPDKKPQ
jgi:hypothetical protein